ncbi:MAG TPA: tetratricopeptide repeat protein [Gammaproteobacteria bacterium]|nr:tetratricopeptide repeat protein [Gammaproteobacteria bacterium]
MATPKEILAFLTKNKGVQLVALVLAFLVGALFGQGAIFQWLSLGNDSERATQARVELETKLIGQLYDYESTIQTLVPRYVTMRDALSDETPRAQRLEYDSLRYQLIGLFLSYNKLEAKLSQLEKRGAQFMLPAQLISPRAPRVAVRSTLPATASSQAVNIVDVTLDEDDVTKAVDQQLELIFDQYNASFRNAYYQQSCKSGLARACVILADAGSGARLEQRLQSEDRELYEKACSLGDSLGCEKLGFNAFYQLQYTSAMQWLTKACDLGSGSGCGFLGTLYASREVAERQDPSKAREMLARGCEGGNNRSCYYLAILYVSGLIPRDPSAAMRQLEIACALRLDEGCKSLEQFEKFQACSSDAVYTLPGEAHLTLECNAPSQ